MRPRVAELFTVVKSQPLGVGEIKSVEFEIEEVAGMSKNIFSTLIDHLVEWMYMKEGPEESDFDSPSFPQKAPATRNLHKDGSF